MTVGNDHVKIWSKNKGQQGKIGEKPESMISCVSSKHIYITGSANGNIYNWIGNQGQLLKPSKHTGKVHVLVST